MTKKTIKDTLSVSLSELEGNLDDVISQLQTWKEEGWEGLDVDYYYESTTYNLYKSRLETDAEYQRRIQQEEHYKENRRKQYEQLKKEFGDA